MNQPVSRYGPLVMSLVVLLCGCSAASEPEEPRSAVEILCDSGSSVEARTEALFELDIEGVAAEYSHPAILQCVGGSFEELLPDIERYCRRRKAGEDDEASEFFLSSGRLLVGGRCLREVTSVLSKVSEDTPAEELQTALDVVQMSLCMEAELTAEAALKYYVSALSEQKLIDESQHGCLRNTLPAFQSGLSDSCERRWTSPEDGAEAMFDWFRACGYEPCECESEVQALLGVSGRR